MIYAIVVAASWLVFIVYWAASATRAKRDATRQSSWQSAVAIRVVVVLAAILLVRLPAAQRLLRGSREVLSFSNPTAGTIGALLSVAGVAVAVWARKCLGTNWSPRPSVKVGHELVTSGPYRWVRHPIYTGMLLAVLGTALDTGILGLVIFLGVCLYLVLRIPVEEGLMLGLFPEQYARYREQTKALIPHVV